MTFDTSLLDQAIAQKQARRQAMRQQTLAALLALLDEQGALFGLSQAYIFGSLVAAGRFHKQSDIDIGVTGLTPAQFFDLMTFLSTELERDIDLVDLQQCHFAHRICQAGTVWIAKQ